MSAESERKTVWKQNKVIEETKKPILKQETNSRPTQTDYKNQEYPKNVHSDDSKSITLKTIPKTKQMPFQFVSDKVIPEGRAFPEHMKAPGQVFTNKNKTLIVTYTCVKADDIEERNGQLAIYRSNDRTFRSKLEHKALCVFNLESITGARLHHVDFHPTLPLLALVFIETLGKMSYPSLFNIALCNYARNKLIFVVKRKIALYEDTTDIDEIFNSPSFHTLIFTANFGIILDKQKPVVEKKETSSEWKTVAKKEKSKAMSYQEQALNYKDIGLIYRVGNCWYSVDIHNPTKIQLEKKIPNKFLNFAIKTCSQGVELPASALNSFSNDIGLIYEPLYPSLNIVTFDDPTDTNNFFFASNTENQLKIWSFRAGTWIRQFELKHRYQVMLKSRDGQCIILSRPKEKENISVSPLAAFSIASFFAKSTNCISYSADIKIIYTMNGISESVTKYRDVVMESATGDRWYLADSYLSSSGLEARKVNGTKLEDIVWELPRSIVPRWKWLLGDGNQLYWTDYKFVYELGKTECLRVKYLRDMKVTNIDGEDVFLVNCNGYLKMWNREGEEKWATPAKLHEKLIVENGVVVMMNKDNFTVLNGKNGELVASQYVKVDEFNRLISCMASWKNMLVVGLQDGRFCVYKKEFPSQMH